MSVTVKRANSDFASLKNLAQSCLDNYTLLHDKMVSKSRKKDFTILFARKGKKKVGFITGYAEKGKMHIWLFGVLKKVRGKGIGYLLLNKFHMFAAKRGYKAVTTITFNNYQNKIILSIKAGYRIIGVKYIKEKKDTAIILEKQIGARK